MVRNCEKSVNWPRKRGFFELYAQIRAKLTLETHYSRAFQSPTVEKRYRPIRALTPLEMTSLPLLFAPVEKRNRPIRALTPSIL